MPRVHFTRHALLRLAERGILEWQVHKAVHNPDSVSKTPEGSVCHRLHFGQRTLKVWLVDDDRTDRFIVKSAAWQGED